MSELHHATCVDGLAKRRQGPAIERKRQMRSAVIRNQFDGSSVERHDNKKENELITFTHDRISCFGDTRSGQTKTPKAVDGPEMNGEEGGGISDTN